MKTLSSLVMILAASFSASLADARGVRAAPSAPAPDNRSEFDHAPWWAQRPVITQIGYVRTEVEANRAHFSANFLTAGKSAQEAQLKAIDATKALTNVLKKLGSEKVRITTSFSMRTLYEEYRDKNGNRIEDQRADRINGYQVTQSFNIEVRDTAVLERAYALVLAANPTWASDISFSLEPSNELKTWLYTEAVKDAHKRAQMGSESAGTRLHGLAKPMFWRAISKVRNRKPMPMRSRRRVPMPPRR